MTTTLRIKVFAAFTALVLATTLTASALPPGDGTVSVIVRGEISLAQAAEAVASLGGTVTTELSIISGVAATIPVAALSRLAVADGIASVTEDQTVTVLGKNDEDDDGGWPENDPQSVYSALRLMGADDYWKDGATGDGIGVALIDTGVSPVEGLDDPGQVIYGPDLSWESQSDNVRHLDTFGHGTHMAGLINGRDTGAKTKDYKKHAQHFMGVAPDAHLISVKIGDAHGTTDVSQIIAAIDWVVQHRNDPGLNIRVLNLSLGMYSAHRPSEDPLAHATSIAWDRGIVVVAAAGNDGDERVGLTSPAYSQRVIAVGAAETNGSKKAEDWQPLAFSARGNQTRLPDILAPGARLSSLRVPGSHLDVSYGDRATVKGRFFRGSGTSQAAAMVSGAAALVLSQHPDWTPDMVRGALVDNGQVLDPAQGFTAETGRIGLRLRDMEELPANPEWSANTQNTPADWGHGTIDQARGDVRIAFQGVPLVGEMDIFGTPINTSALAYGRAMGTNWSGGQYNGTVWTGVNFLGLNLLGNQWSGNQWSGNQWSGNQWSGNQWSGNQWSGNQWSGNQWSGNQWSGNQWSGNQWSGNQWSGDVWSGSRWG